MRIITLPDMPIDAFGSFGVSMCFLPQMGVSEGTKVHIATISTGGWIGEHPAPLWQMFAVIEGDVEVRGGPDERWRRVSPGQAAIWEPGEVHESRANTTTRVVIVESQVEPNLDQ